MRQLLVLLDEFQIVLLLTNLMEINLSNFFSHCCIQLLHILNVLISIPSPASASPTNWTKSAQMSFGKMVGLVGSEVLLLLAVNRVVFIFDFPW